MRRRLFNWLSAASLIGILLPAGVWASTPNLDDPFIMEGAPGSAIVPAGQKLSNDLSATLSGLDPTASVAVLVQTASDPRAGALTALQGAAGGFQPKFVWSEAVYGFAAKLTKAQITALAARPEVVQIEPDRPMYPMLDTATQFTGVQAARAATGLSGRGVVVAVIDSGIDDQHADLAGKVVAWHDTSGEDTTKPTDGNGHGTHVAGIIAGAGKANPQYAGVAPEAKLVGVKVFHSVLPVTESSNTVEGIEWVVKNKDRYGIQVVNMSLGSVTPCTDAGSISTQAVDNAHSKKGLTFVIAAGNTGPGACTISSPADARHAISVGNGIDPAPGVASKRGWGLAISSSRGPTFDGRVKPDIVAPGTAIMSVASGTRDGYTAKSGTSMASPFVAGVAALIKEKHRNWGPDQVKQTLTRSAIPWGQGRPNNEYGWGMVNPVGALDAGTFDGFGIKHETASGSLGAGETRTYTFAVTDPARAATATSPANPGTPLAITLVMTSWQPLVYRSVNGVRVSDGSPDFDLELYAPNGTLVSTSPCRPGLACSVPIVPPVTNKERQEQIRYLPTTAGTYTLKVISRSGAGTYFLDASFK